MRKSLPHDHVEAKARRISPWSVTAKRHKIGGSVVTPTSGVKLCEELFKALLSMDAVDVVWGSGPTWAV